MDKGHRCRECGGLTLSGDGLCAMCRIDGELEEIERDLGLFQADTMDFNNMYPSMLKDYNVIGEGEREK